MAVPAPTESMMEPVRRVVAFQQTGQRSLLDGVFCDDTQILDSFAPYLFAGPGGVDAWARAFGAHVADHRGLVAQLGDPQEFSLADAAAYFSQPVQWTYGLVGDGQDWCAGPGDPGLHTLGGAEQTGAGVGAGRFQPEHGETGSPSSVGERRLASQLGATAPPGPVGTGRTYTELGALAVLLQAAPHRGVWQIRRLAWGVATCAG